MKSEQYYLERASEMDRLVASTTSPKIRTGFAKAAEAYRVLASTAAENARKGGKADTK